MASSPEGAVPGTPGVVDDGVRWPWAAWIGVALAVLTVVAGVVAALVAVFVVLD